MSREHININNERVIALIQEAKKHRQMSKLIEDSLLFYMDNMSAPRSLTREDVKDIIIEYLSQLAFTGPIQNRNYLDEKENLKSDIEEMLELGGD